ncbi:MAG: hypothetical protein HY080_14210 [Gammaproteobacteria bacterium]|nr:hypothetical protein [Gammaproteobacteria bacterium]
MNIRLFLISICLTTGGPALGGGALQPYFNTQQFTGLASDQVMKYDDTLLDYDLDNANHKNIHFRTCRQVEATRDKDILASQYSLFKLLKTNCLALERFTRARPASQGFLPDRLTKKWIDALPATAVPRMNDEDLRRRNGKRLSRYESQLRVVLADDGTANVTTKTDQLTYVIMARADFDGDGIEDMLLRIDWRALRAFGKGTDLVMITKTAAQSPVQLQWRAGVD